MDDQNDVCMPDQNDLAYKHIISITLSSTLVQITNTCNKHKSVINKQQH